MIDKIFPQSQLPVRKTSELLPGVFQTPANNKFMEGVVDPLVQPGLLQKTVGYIGRRYGKTYNGTDVYLDSDKTLRSRYQLEPAVIFKNQGKTENFYDYLDLKNQLKFFGNNEERDDLITDQTHYSWSPPIDWDKFINYREYYWQPSGPPSVAVFGQKASVTSSYRVSLGTESSYIFSPDGFTNNPTIVLYRGQTYSFKVNAPREGFVIRTNFDTGSMRFNPNISYRPGQLIVYDNKLWRAKKEVLPSNGSNIFEGSDDWQYVDLASADTALDYNNGVTNNGAENGTVTFKVGYDSPDVLFYQSKVNPDRFGKFLIDSIETNTKINVDKEIVGKINYTSSNGVKFTNGLIVEFRGQVFPEKYSQDTWLVEGVGTEIKLIRFNDLVVPSIKTGYPDVLFDNAGFDNEPFDDAKSFPAFKDYITINRSSEDSNAWSRYNRWFHREVLEYSYRLRGQDFPAEENLRAKRPIIEFNSGLQLIDHGTKAKQSVDYIENFTEDIFSTIEGSTGYFVDGEELFDGARLLIAADSDDRVNNRIYLVKFITHNGRRQISLVKTDDAESNIGDCLLIKRGVKNNGKTYHFSVVNNEEVWVESQEKTQVNQSPLFDIFDEDGVSYSDSEKYPINNFNGSKILSYKEGNGPIDTELGISLSYLNINNIGDIEFQWNFSTDILLYTKDQLLTQKRISEGYYKKNPTGEYSNGWIVTDNTYLQTILDSVILEEDSDRFILTTIDWTNVNRDLIKIYVNGTLINDDYSIEENTFIFSRMFNKQDAISIKVITDKTPNTGYYEIPAGLEKNPLNEELEYFTFGQSIDHISSAVEFQQDFSGVIPGLSNLRDLSDYQKYSKRFMKHESLSPLAMSLVCDKTSNIIKSLQYAKRNYSNFKNNFIKKSSEVDFVDNVADFVDFIISELTKTKTQNDSFADSDMIGTGAYTLIKYTVDDEGIKTFALSERFTLEENSRRAVYVYVNQDQLLHGRDYEFNSNFGFITIKTELALDDEIEIREYVSTSSCFIPATPTSMGLYKKFTPMKFLDDTYREPTEVIQGHDGSIIVAYGDYRDDLILELEYRIYNNIKQEYDESFFDIDSYLGGYYGNADYNKTSVDDIVAQEFLKWIQNTDINYSINQYYQENEYFTYTYTNSIDPAGTTNLLGWWRGIYKWFYDTDRPHRCPWEMLGFSEKPDWWESEYGPAPYTSNNLILWEDLRNGIIKKGNRSGQYARYARPGIMDHLPVDGDGKLLDPLNSGLAQNFLGINNASDFKFGDISPVEYAWRSSSEWPFAVIIAVCLLKPFRFIPTNFDKTKVKLNRLSQLVAIDTNRFITLSDFSIPTLNDQPSSGLINYLIDYYKSRKISLKLLEEKLTNLDVVLSNRLSGFVDKSQQKYLLDSKNPRSSSSSVFVPPENYEIIFNVSSPILSINYSGVIVEKTNGGWIIRGYDIIQPYFNYFSFFPTQSDVLISVGGVSEKFIDWEPAKVFSNGVIVRYRNQYYRSLRTHESSANFDDTVWKFLPKLPITGGIEALERKNFDKFQVLRLSYGTKLTTVQQVVDFLLGYQEYLKSQGFVFDRYDSENMVSQDWLTSCKEFMFWTKHNWAVGSLITLSPSAQKLDVSIAVGVADNLLDSFYDYQIFKSDGNILSPKNINVNRTFQSLSIETTDTTEGIYYIRIFYVLKEHVVIFSDKTVFNDVIYNKTTGYRQERIKTQGFRTVDWDGDYTSPGFLFDNVNIEPWIPFKDYKLGDIVEYQSILWTSQKNHLGVDVFDESQWSKLDLIPEKQLISNFDYKINQFADYYDVTAEGVGQSQRSLARHAIGYQERTYLQNLAEDPVTQFQLYQGFIKEKGTSNSITKIFEKLSRSENRDSIVLNEEWAFKVGTFGGVDQYRDIEFVIQKDKFVLNPQPLLLTEIVQRYPEDQIYRIYKKDFNESDNVFTTNITPLIDQWKYLRTSGYVKTDQVEFSVKNRDGILNLDINQFQENNNVWITFDGISWTVLRFNLAPTLKIIDAVKEVDQVTIVFNITHNFSVGEIIGIKDIENLSGFFKVDTVDSDSLTVKVPEAAPQPELDGSTVYDVYIFTEARFDSYDSLDEQQIALLNDRSKLWIDDNGNNQWEVIEKIKQYSYQSVQNSGIANPLNLGYKVVYDESLRQVLTSIPGSNYVVCYSETTKGLAPRNIIEPLISYRDYLSNSFGYGMAISPDGKWLAVSAPLASDIPSYYRGEFFVDQNYEVNDIVLYDGEFWKSSDEIIGDDSSEFVQSLWEKVDLLTADPSSVSIGSGYENQGIVFIYEKVGLRWNIRHSIISPYLEENERFGHSIDIAKTNDGYIMAVSSMRSDNSGRVYLYEYYDSWKNSLGQLYIENGLISTGDKFGFSISLNYDGSILAVGAPEMVSQDTTETGTVFIYEKDEFYDLSQIIEKDSIENISLRSGDKFGYSLDLDYSGNLLAISSPYSDQEFENQGSVYVFKRIDNEYQLINPQQLVSFENYADEYFGWNVKITPNSEKIVVSARNTITNSVGSVGGVYVFELKDDRYFLAEKLEADFLENESFGFSIDVAESVIVVGSPDYETTEGTVGNLRLFRKDQNSNSWNVIDKQSTVVDITKIENIFVYDIETNTKLQDLDFVDHAKFKILNSAEQEIKFKTFYDPAVYSIGSDDQNVNSDIAWTTRHVGELWWDISSVKWVNYEQGDLVYKTGNWNVQAAGSSVDVYEWVETILLPSEWAALADTNEGLAEGISGQPLYPDDTVYSVKILYNSATGQPTETRYYYWVKNKAIVPANLKGRRISARDVASLIDNPQGSGIAFLCFVSADSLLAVNFRSILNSDFSAINIRYTKNDKSLNPIHNEYKLLTEEVADSLPPESLEKKWIDSLVGYDAVGNPVPDPELPVKKRYGIYFRPRQSMFVDRNKALKIVVDHVNSVLSTDSFSDIINFRNLNLVDQIPDPGYNFYDLEFDTEIDLINVITARIRPATIRANLLNEELDSIEIIDPGFGYKVPPSIVIEGDGVGAKISFSLDIQGRIKSPEIISRGKRYSFMNIKIREFSVLVKNDSTIGGFWSIYSWDVSRKIFYRTNSQSFDTTRYWSKIDWWKSGYNITSRIVKEIFTIDNEPPISLEIGDLVRIKEYGQGGWAVFEKVSDTGTTFLSNYLLVGRQNGTIKLNESIYDISLSRIGYDNRQSFDIGRYDPENFRELRNIFTAVKEDIFVGDYRVEWNKIFFASIRYVFSEQQYVDWAFKTSFLNATHNIGPLKKKLNYKNDNLSSFQEYIDEVKPYRTTIREYVSKYQNVDTTSTAITDFDIPAAYSTVDGKIIPITERNSMISQYPWKWWLDNKTFSVIEIRVTNSGSGYISPPSVLIEGNGTGVEARAFVSGGRVTRVEVISQGSRFLDAPKISLVGGNGTNPDRAKAIAILGSSKIRTFDMTIKFDRISRFGFYENLDTTDTFIASGFNAVFELTYLPNPDKSKIEITKNNDIVLLDDFELSIYQVPDSLHLRGKIIFKTAPNKDSVIRVVYEKNDSLLDSVNRIQKHYNPIAGMKGKSLSQLMTGIDFGGVQIQGSLFDSSGGWDSVPWFTDSWDSVESSLDYYYLVQNETASVTLPYVPELGQNVNIYIKKINSDKFVRIDDPNYQDGDDLSSSTSTSITGSIPTFVGNGEDNVIDVSQYISLNEGDILIFRPEDSDGSVKINDPNLIDTDLSGGSLSAVRGAYVTANGITAEEILVEGGVLISPDNVPAPEENVPGQILDSVSIKVFQENEELTSAFMIHKDMLNSHRYTRFSITEVSLSNDLYYYDQEITVSDASRLPIPATLLNIPGSIYINGERIEYFSKQGNVLSQLRRGAQGTSIKELHQAGSKVVDIGYNQNFPYQESQETVNLNSDGSTLLLGPLEFIPSKANRNNWYRETIPAEYGACDEIEVFVAGRRLRKDPISVYDELKGEPNRNSDKILEAEFSVDGETPYIRLTEVIENTEIKIVVIKRTGRSWYERGENTASKGISLLENDTSVARFIAQKTTENPE
jgi:hypothetical protein